MNRTEDRLSMATVTGHLLVTGKLTLESPLLIGRGADYGETVNTVDTLVVVDENGHPYIPGTSFAGVLRDRMSRLDREDGGKESLTELLFGSDSQRSGARQSAVRFDDIPLPDAVISVRDGVRIHPVAGVGEHGGKFDYEVVERGAGGVFQLDIVLRGAAFPMEDGEGGDPGCRMRAGVRRLLGILDGTLELGAMTAKGLGRVRIHGVETYLYDFSRKEAVAAWLLGGSANRCDGRFRIALEPERLPEESRRLTVDASFALRSSLIVRDRHVDGEDKEEKISAVQMRSGKDYVIPGTTLKGVLRSRMAYILRRLGADGEKGRELVDSMMGSSDDSRKVRSRLSVEETYIPANGRGVREYPQTRNRVDRFTNATVDSALFTTKPLWKEGDNAPVRLRMEIRECAEDGWDIGCLLFLLKDLWLGEAAIGGEKSIGRGTLEGREGVIRLGGKEWRLDRHGKLTGGDSGELERYAAAFLDRVKGGEGHE